MRLFCLEIIILNTFIREEKRRSRVRGNFLWCYLTAAAGCFEYNGATYAYLFIVLAIMGFQIFRPRNLQCVGLFCEDALKVVLMQVNLWHLNTWSQHSRSYVLNTSSRSKFAKRYCSVSHAEQEFIKCPELRVFCLQRKYYSADLEQITQIQYDKK